MPKVSVVIPNLNGKKYLAICLPSLAKQTFKNFETIVVDNASSDGSVEFLRENYPEVRVIENKKNEGFAKPVNQGIAAARGRYVALLNNDTEAGRGWLEELVKVLDERGDVASCASKMLNFHNRKTIDSAGDGWSWEHMGGYNIGRGKKDGKEFLRPRLVFGACAGAAMYRKELFIKVGLFDEKFFAYFEDIDLDFRAQLAGLKCLYVPDAVVYHIGGVTSGKRRRLREFLISRNQLMVILKDFPSDLIWKHKRKLFRVAFGPLKAFLGHPKAFYLAILARLQVFLWLPWIVRERIKIQRQRKISIKELERILI